MNNVKVEEWCGFYIRFIEVDGQWWAILKDICDALGLRTDGIAQRIDPELLLRVRVESSDIGSNEVGLKGDHSSNGVSSGRNGVRRTQHMLAISEIGIYEALFASRKLEARKFRRWSCKTIQKLRMNVGLEGYQIMNMTDPEVQEEIDDILDTLFYDERTGKLMRSVTLPGGDVDQVPFEEE